MISCLSEFGHLPAYRYVGLGSPYYGDFRLFHRQFGFDSMISIERDEATQERCDFNKPYDAIVTIRGDIGEVLTNMPMDERSIFWLDFDGKLDESILGVVGFIVSNAAAGSLLVVTLNVHPDGTGRRIVQMEQRVGAKRVPMGLKEADLGGWKLSNLTYNLLLEDIKDKLRSRNLALRPAAQIGFEQMMHFEYQDKAQMFTLGGLIHDRGQRPLVKRCGFSDRWFYRNGQKALRIDAPALTFKEMREIDRQLPTTSPESINVPGVPIESIRAYERVYRYFPAFVEAEL